MCKIRPSSDHLHPVRPSVRPSIIGRSEQFRFGGMTFDKNVDWIGLCLLLLLLRWCADNNWVNAVRVHSPESTAVIAGCCSQRFGDWDNCQSDAKRDWVAAKRPMHYCWKSRRSGETLGPRDESLGLIISLRGRWIKTVELDVML